MVFQQGLARLYNVHNHVGQAQDGSQLDGAVELDDVDVAGLGRVVLCRDVGEFGGHPEGSAGRVVEVFWPGHAHTAPADAQIQQLVHVGLVLQQDIPAGHPHVGRPPLHIDAHVGGLHPEIPHSLLPVFKGQPAVFLQNLGAVVPGGGKGLVGPLPQPPLGQRHIDHSPTSSGVMPLR